MYKVSRTVGSDWVMQLRLALTFILDFSPAHLTRTCELKHPESDEGPAVLVLVNVLEISDYCLYKIQLPSLNRHVVIHGLPFSLSSQRRPQIHYNISSTSFTASRYLLIAVISTVAPRCICTAERGRGGPFAAPGPTPKHGQARASLTLTTKQGVADPSNQYRTTPNLQTTSASAGASRKAVGRRGERVGIDHPCWIGRNSRQDSLTGAEM
jgi:hypothetical protein